MPPVASLYMSLHRALVSSCLQRCSLFSSGDFFDNIPYLQTSSDYLDLLCGSRMEVLSRPETPAL